MKKLTVKENGTEVYFQTLEGEKSKLSEGIEDYSQYSNYFHELLESISQLCQEVNLILNVNNEATLLTLYLTDEELNLNEEIKKKLLANFPDDIEQIGIVGNEVNIMDFFYEFN